MILTIQIWLCLFLKTENKLLEALPTNIKATEAKEYIQKLKSMIKEIEDIPDQDDDDQEHLKRLKACLEATLKSNPVEEDEAVKEDLDEDVFDKNEANEFDTSSRGNIKEEAQTNEGLANINENVAAIISDINKRHKKYVKAIAYLEKHKIWIPQLSDLRVKEKAFAPILKGLKKNKKNDTNIKLPGNLTLSAVFGYDESEREEKIKNIKIKIAQNSKDIKTIRSAIVQKLSADSNLGKTNAK